MLSSKIRLSEEEKKNLAKNISTKKSPYMESVLSMWREFKKNIITGTVSLFTAVSLCFAANALDLRLGYEVILDGETVGLVTEQDSAFEAIDAVKADMIKFMNDDSYDKEPTFVLRMVSGSDISSVSDIKEHLLSHLNYMVDCVGIYVDGEPAFGVTSKEAADWILEKHKKDSIGKEIEGSAEIDFVEKVEIKDGHLHISLLKTPEEALALLKGENNFKDKSYVVKENDTLWEIAKSHDISLERLLALNDGVDEGIKEGDVLKIEAVVPLLSVRTVRQAEYSEEIPYEVEKIKDESSYENTTVVSQKGVNGEGKEIGRAHV